MASASPGKSFCGVLPNPMNRTLLVLKNEFITVVIRRSFWLTLVLVPTISFLVVALVSYLEKGSGDDGKTPNPVQQLLSSPPGPALEGYIDLSGLIVTLPPDLTGRLQEFDSQAEAENALQQGIIKAFYIVGQDYLQKGTITSVRPDFNPLAGIGQADVIQQALVYNLLNGNQALAERINQPVNLEVVYLSSQPARDPGDMLTLFLPYLVMLLFYMVILESSSLMLSSVTSEKTNRLLEILMTSISPVQLLTGKIIALGLVGLLQTVVWTAAGYSLLQYSGQTFSLPASFQLPPSILAWGVVFFVLGYAMYASLMAGVGALVPNLRESSQATTILMIPMMVPLMLISVIAAKPNGLLAVILSLFPLTGPVTMMARLAAGTVPAWQLILSVILFSASALVFIRITAGLFRTQNLLSGQKFKFRLLFKALAGRA
jgi:ABC-2 type transport system permease protein